MALNTKFGSTLLSSFFQLGYLQLKTLPLNKNFKEKEKTRGVSQCLPFTLKRILRQKKNYGNSNTFHLAKI
jgi:hypothetical protein